MDVPRRSVIAAGISALSYSRIVGANERPRLAGLGTGGRCAYLLGIASRAGAEIVAACDVYGPHRERIRAEIAPRARPYVDYHEVLDQKDIDAVVVGAPDHWHVAMTADAVRSGKDVYVEKPLTHTIEESVGLEKQVADSGRIVQVGYQQRSWEHYRQARELVANGKLGKIALVLSSWHQNYVRMRQGTPGIDVNRLDWQKFLGQARPQAFDPIRYVFWRWYWDFGGGHLTDLHSHWGDVINWYLGLNRPLAVECMGQPAVLPDFECPDTITAAWSYPGDVLVTYFGTLAGAIDSGNLIFRGTEAMLKLNRDGFALYPEGGQDWGATTLPAPIQTAKSQGDGTIAHVANFLDCIKTRQTPNAPVQSSLAAAAAAHLGNTAFRKGTRLNLA